MRVAVTGATGFIGGSLARRLRDRGDTVVALVRDPARAVALRELGVELVAGDLDDAAALATLARGADGFVHGAALYRIGVPAAERARLHAVNVDGTDRALRAAAEAGVPRIVAVSTVNVFGNTHGRVVDEEYRRDLAEGFLTAYDETKYRAHEVAERLAAEGVPVVIVQPGAVYGAGDHSELGDQVDRAMRGRLPFVSFAHAGLTMCHVEDVAAGIVLALDTGRAGRAYVLGGEITTLGHVVDTAARAAGRRAPRLAMPGWAIKAGIPAAPVVTRLMGMPPNLRELIRASDGVTYWATDRRARQELGYAPRDLETGMRELATTVRAG